jgi:hypothetical protein
MKDDGKLRVGQMFGAMVELGMRAERGRGRFVGEDGRPVRKTKYTHPYSYDPFVVWRGEGEANGSAYTDRLLQWDYDKHNELRRRHFGDVAQLRWGTDDPAKIEAFLRDFFDSPELRLVKVVEYCNVSNGYPCWRLDFFTPSPETSAA